MRGLYFELIAVLFFTLEPDLPQQSRSSNTFVPPIACLVVEGDRMESEVQSVGWYSAG